MNTLIDINKQNAPSWLRIFSSPLIKVLIAAGVVALLVYFNRVDATVLVGLTRTWPWLLAAFALMLPPFVVLSFRLQVILRSQGIRVPILQAIRWTMIGLFFDLAMPSSCGGDLIKVGCLFKHVGTGQRGRAMMAVAFDRALGLIGLFLLASLASVFGWEILRDLPARNMVVAVAVGVGCGSLLILQVAGSDRLYRNPVLDRVLSRNGWGRRVKEIIESFNALRARPLYLTAALGLSVLNHVFWCASLFCIVRAVGVSVELVKGLVVFPLALFSNIFGVAGGFGGGTAGFDLLFSQLLAIGNGALIGLLFQGLSALARLAGLPFYLHSPSNNNPDC